MKIQFFSDIHLEFGPLAFPHRDADVIVAAGDIGLGIEGIDWLRASRCPVVYIAGNHEFYGEDMLTMRSRLQQAAAGSQLHYLEQTSKVIDGVRFVGCTLWTDFSQGDPGLMSVVRENMNDYCQILYRDTPLLPEDILRQHRESLSWLHNELNRPFMGPTVVVTHHAPSRKSWDQEQGHPLRDAYCNTMESFMRDFDIALWIHGHIHACADYRCGNTRVVCNPRGYHGYQKVPGFDPGKCVSID